MNTCKLLSLFWMFLIFLILWQSLTVYQMYLDRSGVYIANNSPWCSIENPRHVVPRLVDVSRCTIEKASLIHSQTSLPKVKPSCPACYAVCFMCVCHSHTMLQGFKHRYGQVFETFCLQGYWFMWFECFVNFFRFLTLVLYPYVKVYVWWWLFLSNNISRCTSNSTNPAVESLPPYFPKKKHV